MVVVVIIGMLAGAVAIKVGGYMETARTNRARSDLARITEQIETYYTMHSRYPSNSEGLDALDSLKSTTDPWGNPYQYNSPGQEGPFEVFTLGADNREGGAGINADIYSWQLDRQREDGQGP